MFRPGGLERKGKREVMSPSNEGQTEDLLSAYLEDDLSEAERARVEELLRTSEEARKDLEALRRTVSLLKELEEPEPPPTLWESVSGRLAETGPSAGWAEGGIRLAVYRVPPSGHRNAKREYSSDLLDVGFGLLEFLRGRGRDVIRCAAVGVVDPPERSSSR